MVRRRALKESSIISNANIIGNLNGIVVGLLRGEDGEDGEDEVESDRYDEQELV